MLMEPALDLDPELTTLNLDGASLGIAQIRKLADSLAQPNALTELELAQTRLKDEGAILLAKALQTNRSLKLLSLQACSIRESGAREIAGVLTTGGLAALR